MDASNSVSIEVDAQLVCLNDEATIRESLISLLKNRVGKMVVVDGGSSDKTLEKIRDLPVEILTSPAGIDRQTALANDHMERPYIFVSEADQVYDEEFVHSLLCELKQSGLDGIQARKYRDFGPGFWAKGQSIFLEINQPGPGPSQFMSGPQLWHRDAFRGLISSMPENGTYSFDTSFSDLIAKRGLRIGIAETATREIGSTDYRAFRKRMKDYGKGDNSFYSQNSPSWSPMRRLRSVLHPFSRYVVQYPVRAAQLGHPVIGTVFFFLIAVHRYFFWVEAVLLTRTNRFISREES